MDHYLQDRTRLKGQPKRTIADYVEQNGILVPRRFDTLAEARRSGAEIFLRSEHEQEYDGCSGLLESLTLDNQEYPIKDARDVDEVKRIFFDTEANNPHIWPIYQQYCKFSGTEEQRFINEVTYSLWERLGGHNIAVIEDSSIPGRFHVMSTNPEDYSRASYMLVDKGTKELSAVPTPREVSEVLERIIGMYKEVRGLPNFDPKHCPLMEMQVHEGKVFFLQYHRVRDSIPARHVLEREAEDDEQEMLFVRGHTGPEGKTSKVTAFYGGERDWNFDAEDEQGSFDNHPNRVFPELQVRKRQLQVMNLGCRRLSWAMLQLAMGHDSRSMMFKPEVSVIGIFNELLDESYDARKVNFRSADKKNITVDLHVVSDGRRAFVKRV